VLSQEGPKSSDTLKAVKVDDGEEDGGDFVINLDDVVQAEKVVAQENLPDIDYDVSILGKVKKVIQQDNYEEMILYRWNLYISQDNNLSHHQPLP
jgi:hypothetical protein